jgi:hypothetical protein
LTRLPRCEASPSPVPPPAPPETDAGLFFPKNFHKSSLSCSFCARVASSLPSLPSRPPSSPRTTLPSSQRPRSPVRLFILPSPHPLADSPCANNVADPTAECTPYYYAPSAQYVHNFPTIWQPATLLANDSAGQAMWNKIAGNVPNIPPKGQLNGSTIGVTYDGVNDPDCCKSRLCPLSFIIRWRWSVWTGVSYCEAAAWDFS